MTMTRPDFLVIGAQRAGTSLLHRILAAHPEVYVPTQRKEVHFFDRYFERGEGWYASYFPAPREAQLYRAIGEVTPDYLAHPEAPARIHATLPGCRLIAILRDPVDRAFSWYQYCRRNRCEQREFSRFLDEDDTAVEYGLYHKHLSRFLEIHPRQSLKAMLYEDLTCDPAGELGALAAFLGLSSPFADPNVALAERVNAGIVPRHARAFALARRLGGTLMRHDVNWPVRVAKRLGVRRWFGRTGKAPVLDAASRARVAARYAEDVAGLSGLLGLDLHEIWSVPC